MVMILISQERVQMLISFVFSESCPLFQLFQSYNDITLHFNLSLIRFSFLFIARAPYKYSLKLQLKSVTCSHNCYFLHGEWPLVHYKGDDSDSVNILSIGMNVVCSDPETR